MIIISDPTVPEISSTYVTDLATDGSAELDPDGLPTPSSATDTISLLAIPPHLTQTPRCADRPEPTRLHTTRTRIAVPLSALNHCRYLRNVAATHTSTSADLSRVLPPCLHHRSSRHFSPPATLPIATALAAALSAPPNTDVTISVIPDSSSCEPATIVTAAHATAPSPLPSHTHPHRRRRHRRLTLRRPSQHRLYRLHHRCR